MSSSRFAAVRVLRLRVKDKHANWLCGLAREVNTCGLRKSMKRFPPRPAACVTAAPAPKAGKILESEDGSALCAERSMIVTSMQLTISSRRDIAVLQKESSALEGEEDVNVNSGCAESG